MNLTGQLSIPKPFHTFKYTDLAIKSIKNYKKASFKKNEFHIQFPRSTTFVNSKLFVYDYIGWQWHIVMILLLYCSFFFHVNGIIRVDFFFVKYVVYNVGFFLTFFSSCQLGCVLFTPLCAPILKPNLMIMKKSAKIS